MEPGPLCLVNCIPFVSQLKSVVILALDLNPRKAWNVQRDFFHTSTLVSQVISGLHFLNFEHDKAVLVQRRYLQYIDSLTDTIWFTGPIKYVAHRSRGDRLGARRALRGATRSIAFLSTGTIAYFQMELEMNSTIVLAIISGCFVDAAFERDQPEYLEGPGQPPELPVGTCEGIFDNLAEIMHIPGIWANFVFYKVQYETNCNVSGCIFPQTDRAFKNWDYLSRIMALMDKFLSSIANNLIRACNYL